jgi:hypothetical protein
MTVHPIVQASVEPTFLGSDAISRPPSFTPPPTSHPSVPTPPFSSTSEVGEALARTAINDRQAMLALIIKFLGEKHLEVPLHIDLRA